MLDWWGSLRPLGLLKEASGPKVRIQGLGIEEPGLCMALVVPKPRTCCQTVAKWLGSGTLLMGVWVSANSEFGAVLRGWLFYPQSAWCHPGHNEVW